MVLKCLGSDVLVPKCLVPKCLNRQLTAEADHYQLLTVSVTDKTMHHFDS